MGLSPAASVQFLDDVRYLRPPLRVKFNFRMETMVVPSSRSTLHTFFPIYLIAIRNQTPNRLGILVIAELYKLISSCGRFYLQFRLLKLDANLMQLPIVLL